MQALITGNCFFDKLGWMSLQFDVSFNDLGFPSSSQGYQKARESALIHLRSSQSGQVESGMLLKHSRLLKVIGVQDSMTIVKRN